MNDGLVLISKFNSNLRAGKSYDESLFGAGKERFRAIFLTSITTMAGLAPIIFEKSFQAQLLKPMAISIAYGIGYATFLTLILLPILLSLNNTFKLNFVWLRSVKKLDKREVEAPVIELKREKNEKINYILLIFFNISYAQDILTIDMAVKLTLENNLDIKVSENILEISKNNSSILNSDYLPTISATSGITRNQGDVEENEPRYFS